MFKMSATIRNASPVILTYSQLVQMPIILSIIASYFEPSVLKGRVRVFSGYRVFEGYFLHLWRSKAELRSGLHTKRGEGGRIGIFDKMPIN